MQAARKKIFATCDTKFALARAIGTLARKIKLFCELRVAHRSSAQSRRLSAKRAPKAFLNAVEDNSAQLTRATRTGEPLAAFC